MGGANRRRRGGRARRWQRRGVGASGDDGRTAQPLQQQLTPVLELAVRAVLRHRRLQQVDDAERQRGRHDRAVAREVRHRVRAREVRERARRGDEHLVLVWAAAQARDERRQRAVRDERSDGVCVVVAVGADGW